jgi:integrase/recombinase XerD
MLSSGFYLVPGRATMLETIFRRRHHIRRLRANPLGPILDQFVDHLIARGHTTNVVHQYVRAAEHYGHWLGSRHVVVTVDQLTRASARQFLHEHLVACSCPVRLPCDLVNCRAATNHLLRMLDGHDPARCLPPPTPHDSLLTEYDGFLRQACGLSGHTRGYRLRYARQFLESRFGGDPPSFDGLRPADVQDYFRYHAARLSPGSVAVLACSLRSFFRFLTLSHGLGLSLAGVVPAAPRWPKDRLPKSLTEGDLRAVLGRFDDRSATGRRDLAMMRCMSDLGLRVSEVVELTLDDLDWRRGLVVIRGGKGRRSRALPLPAPLGRAITAYLRDGRPPSGDRHLFLRHSVPAGTPVTHTLIRGVFRRAYAAATGKTDSVGTHVLRHTAAARMRTSGHGLKGIADVLGHRSVDTTTVYIKLDVEALRGVALPWPGGAS